jgi:tetratricopeptide (TPR) repeat protein
VEAAPDDAARWRSLIEALLAGRRAEAAAQVCAAALERFGEGVELLTAQARALTAAGLAVPARQALERVADLAPEDPDVAFGLALQALEAGAWEVAERAVARLGDAASSPRVLWLRARIAFSRGDAEGARALAAAALASPGLAPDQMAETSLLMGEALDALGRHAEAFEAAAKGKAALRAFYAHRAAGRESELARVQRLQAWLAASDPASWARPSAAPGSAQVHAFLVGFPRSGTTLLEQALAGHPEVTTLEEAPTLARAADALMTSPAGLARLSRLGDDEAAHWRNAYWSVAAAHRATPAGGVFLDKAPAGTAYLPLIAQLFPNARILFAIRDPRDVALSCFRNSFQMNALTYAFTDLGETARVYAASSMVAA